jgi:hypothetical protein
MRRTRLGKVVGSYRPPLDEWTYWAEANWTDNRSGFMVVAPSGARMTWHESENAARAEVAQRNRERGERHGGV